MSGGFVLRAIYIECSRYKHPYTTSYNREGRFFPAIFEFFLILKSVLQSFQKKMLMIEFKKVKRVCQNRKNSKIAGIFCPSLT